MNLPHLFRLQTSPPNQTEHFFTGNHRDVNLNHRNKPTSNDCIGRIGLHRLRHRVLKSIHRLKSRSHPNPLTFHHSNKLQSRSIHQSNSYYPSGKDNKRRKNRRQTRHQSRMIQPRRSQNHRSQSWLHRIEETTMYQKLCYRSGRKKI